MGDSTNVLTVALAGMNSVPAIDVMRRMRERADRCDFRQRLLNSTGPKMDQADAETANLLRCGADALAKLLAAPELPIWVDEGFVVRMLDSQPLTSRNLGNRLWQFLEAGGIQDGEQIQALLGALRHAAGDPA